MDYLTKRVCAKSFAPFVCTSETHVYDVAEVSKFYANYIEQMRRGCIACRLKESKIEIQEENKIINVESSNNVPQTATPTTSAKTPT